MAALPVRDAPNFAPTGLLAAGPHAQAQLPRAPVPMKWAPPRNALLPYSRWAALVARKDDAPFPNGAKLVAVADDAQSASANQASHDLRRQPAFLLGRDAATCDIVLPHPSSSGQHAALFFCAVADAMDPGAAAAAPQAAPAKGGTGDDEWGAWNPEVPDDLDGEDVDLYVTDLGSTHGTTLNGHPLQPWRNVRLGDRDVLTFGLCSRSYVVLLPQ